MKNKKKKTQLDLVREALDKFWVDYNRRRPIKARHTEIVVKPRFFIGGELNPQVAQKIVEVYLAKLTVKHILEGKVIINDDSIQIKDETSKVIVEVNSSKLVNQMVNQVTVLLGRHLAEKEIIKPKINQIYSFGDINEALIKFLNKTEKHDSKNLVREATVMLIKDKKLNQENKQSISKSMTLNNLN